MEDNKVLLAIAAELKEIKFQLLEEKKKENIFNNKELDSELNYVVATEQRFIDLNKKLDQILCSQKNTATEHRYLIWAGMILSFVVITKMIIDVAKIYLAKFI
jgi:hypothetical protein